MHGVGCVIYRLQGLLFCQLMSNTWLRAYRLRVLFLRVQLLPTRLLLLVVLLSIFVLLLLIILIIALDLAQCCIDLLLAIVVIQGVQY